MSRRMVRINRKVSSDGVTVETFVSGTLIILTAMVVTLGLVAIATSSWFGFIVMVCACAIAYIAVAKLFPLPTTTEEKPRED